MYHFFTFQSNNWFKSKLFCNKSCDNEAKHRLKISQKEELDRERKAKFEKHLNELVLLMRCKNNQLCNETKPCDSCDRIIKSFKQDLDAKYLSRLGNEAFRMHSYLLELGIHGKELKVELGF